MSANADSNTRTTSDINPNTSSQFGKTPGPPFHRATININLEPQSVSGFMQAQATSQLNLPARERRQLSEDMRTYTVSDNSEMDVSTDEQPSPATTNSQSQAQSRGGSISHTSQSPQYQAELQNLQFRNSPKSNIANNIFSQSTMPAGLNPSPDSTFFTASESMFSATMYNTLGTMGGDPGSFMMGNEWDMSGMGAGATGMTPMSENSWNQMLDGLNMEGVTMGWETMGAPRQNSPR